MTEATAATETEPAGGHTLLAVLTWTWVSVPFLYGVYSLVLRIPALFST